MRAATTQFIVTDESKDVDGKKSHSHNISAHNVFYEKEESYVKTYERLELPFSMICQTSKSLFMMMAHMMSYADNGQEVKLDKLDRERLREKLGISVPMLDHCLKELRDVLLISRVVRGTYAINPWYASRGDWKDVGILRDKFDILVDTKGNDTIVANGGEKHK